MTAGSGRILVMEDEEALRKFVQLLPTRAGYESEGATDGEEAVALFRKASIAHAPEGDLK